MSACGCVDVFRRLLIDVGNSRMKWTLAEDAELLPASSAAHLDDPLAVLKAAKLPSVDAVWISDVLGGQRRQALKQAVQKLCGVEAHFAAVRARHAGLTCAYETPSRLGVDRWLMLLAAWRESGAAACVASAGTALTFDAVDASGQHLGGCIAPGLWAMQQAVLDTTAFQAATPAVDYDDELGTDTEACVRQGGLHAAAGLLDRLGARYAKAGAPCLLAGGDAPYLLPHLRAPWQHRPMLVLEGLLALALSAAKADARA